MLFDAITISLMTFAVWFSMLRGMIFSGIRYFLYGMLPEKLHKPVFECPVCMSFWYGNIFYFLMYIGEYNIKEALLTSIAGIGVSAVISTIFKDYD